MVSGSIEITSVEPVIFFSITETDVYHYLSKDSPIIEYYQQNEPQPLRVAKTIDKPSQLVSTIDYGEEVDDDDADDEAGEEADDEQDVGTPTQDEDSSGSPPQDMIKYNPYDINQRLPMVEIAGRGMTPTQYLLGNEFKSYRNLYEPEPPYQLVGRIVTKLKRKGDTFTVTIEWTRLVNNSLEIFFVYYKDELG